MNASHAPTLSSRSRLPAATADFRARLRNVLGASHPGGDVEQLARQFLSPSYAGPKFLLGRNAHSAALLERMTIDGIVDDYAPEHSWLGHPVIKCEDVPKNAIVANCSMSISPISAFRRLQGLGLFGCLYYADLLRACPQVVPEPFFVSEAKADIAAHEGHWISLYDRLCDQRSKVILSDLLGYRLSGDPRCMADYSVRVSDQYFESFLRLNNEVFVDAGGFDGDTAAQFCRRFADYRRVILFEPSARNMLAAKARLAGVRDVEFVEKGLSNDSGSLRFDPDAGAASAVVSVGSCSIDVTTLDASIGQEVSFIKMDLEGWELKALEGSRNHIRADHPKLAIAVYHAAADFWLIPEYIANLREDYDLYLRHYTEGWSETVMFFVPRNSA